MALVVLGWLARFLPVAVLLTRAGFARVPGELEEAATLAGRSGLARSVRVLLPLAAPGLVAAWLAVYVLSATEFAATQIAISPGNPLIGPTIVNFVHYGQDAKTAAAGLILVGAVVLPLLPLAAVIFIAKRHPWHSS
jgi:iron(III) transport system permease protein